MGIRRPYRVPRFGGGRRREACQGGGTGRELSGQWAQRTSFMLTSAPPASSCCILAMLPSFAAAWRLSDMLGGRARR